MVKNHPKRQLWHEPSKHYLLNPSSKNVNYRLLQTTNCCFDTFKYLPNVIRYYIMYQRFNYFNRLHQVDTRKTGCTTNWILNFGC